MDNGQLGIRKHYAFWRGFDWFAVEDSNWPSCFSDKTSDEVDEVDGVDEADAVDAVDAMDGENGQWTIVDRQ
jgi:hypothetical protein